MSCCSSSRNTPTLFQQLMCASVVNIQMITVNRWLNKKSNLKKQFVVMTSSFKRPQPACFSLNLDSLSSHLSFLDRALYSPCHLKSVCHCYFLLPPLPTVPTPPCIVTSLGSHVLVDQVKTRSHICRIIASPVSDMDPLTSLIMNATQ